MATVGAVLGVIRAFRPTLRSAIERVAFAIHATFLAVGYSIVAVGADVNATATDVTEEHEVGCEGWNALEGAYAFRYSGAGQRDLCKSLTLKLVVIEESLMVDVAPFDSDLLHHLEIRASDFAKDGEQFDNYIQQFSNLDDLVKRINDGLLTKICHSQTMITSNLTATSSATLQNDSFIGARRASSPPLLYDTRRSISNPVFMFPPIFMGSNSDLFPRGGGGIFAPRRDYVSDGMLMGPNDVRWQQPNGGYEQQTGESEEMSLLPNMRYDPIGPPGILDIDNRSPSRPPERHPDLEHF